MKYFLYFGCFDSHTIEEYNTKDDALAARDKYFEDEHYLEYATIRIFGGTEIV